MYDLVSHHIEANCNVPDDLLVERAVSFLDDQRVCQKQHELDPIDYIRKVMKERNLQNKDMKVFIGSSGHVSAVLNKKIPLSLNSIRNLHRYLDIPAEILIQPYKCH